MSSKQSLIIKQIHKMNPTLKKKWLTYSMEHFQYVTSVASKEVDNNNMESVSSSFLILKEMFELRSRNQMTTEKMNTILNNYNNSYSSAGFIMTTTAGAFVDLYYLARSFKPVEGENPVLSLSYLGVRHIRQIKYFLKTFLLYESVFSIENTNTNLRCLQIKPEINLSQLLNSYGYLNQRPKSPKTQSPANLKQTKLSKIKKTECLQYPEKYEWIVGKGCYKRKV